MPLKPLNVIVACSENRVIGRAGRLPWRIAEDQEFFHRKTAGQICVLGRLGFERWPRASLDGRRPVVLTSGNPAPAPGQAPPLVARSLPAALALAESLPGDIFICGGQRIYEETLLLPRPIRLYLTLVHAEVPGDTRFPEWRQLPWHETSRRESADANFRYTFLVLERNPG